MKPDHETSLPAESTPEDDDMSYKAATHRAEVLIAHLDDLVRQAGERAVRDRKQAS